MRTLVASAGYGKTTLADQWVSRDGRRAAWYTARRASIDVAALALSIARAASEIVTGCDERLREHLRAVPNPSQHVEVLAELLGEDLADWSADDWLVLDEYQEVVGASEAERFVAELVSACPIRLLIASRQRPSWITARSILYGDVLELNQFALAMDSREAAEVLGEASLQSASGLVALANGWPAVIGLAGVSSAEIEGEEQVPESLYRFFAEEVFDALGDDVRDGLATLSVAPLLDRELAAKLLGIECFDSVCAAALDVGILDERGAQLELHPLARSFLDERPERRAEAEAVAAARALEHYKARRDWDAAFDLISRRGPTGELESLLLAALDDLLNAARLSTIETWCDFAATSRLAGPVFSLARAEVSLRHGRHSEAQAFAEVAATQPGENPELCFRALSAAGRAAHLASREEDALELHRRAEKCATNDAERRDALWGQLTCAIELELPRATKMLAELSAGVRMSDPRDLVRAATCTTIYQLKMGVLDMKHADTARQLLGAVSDPLIETAFQSVYANSLALGARYEEALEVADALLTAATRYRFDFAVPYARYSAAVAYAGLRDWREAERCLDESAASAQAVHDRFAEQACYAVRLRSLAQQGRHHAALSVPVPELGSALRSIHAEVMGSRALVLTTAGRLDDALVLVEEIRDVSRAIEVAVLVPAVAAIVALKRGDARAIDLVAELENAAFATGAVDILVTAYRSAPELLPVLLRTQGRSERVAE
ncbi:MAG: hypothetical protein H0U82_07970, partial [Actinobacteria bacterium]|nr:hypothetical protein [Actinomycetota bacterium]